MKANFMMNRSTKEKGSALLIGLMVMAGLSMLGLGFVAVSETETAISVNQRNAVQTAAVAEAGARAVVEWFQNPRYATSIGIMPAKSAANSAALKNDRFQTGALSNIGKYDEAADYFCCDRPYKPLAEERLFGSGQAEDFSDSDISIHRISATTSTTVAETFLDQFNQRLFPANNEGVRVTAIDVFGPPMIGATRNTRGYWDLGDRYGLATIRVTAEKRVQNQVVSTRTVRIVVNEWPFPGPQGPIQSNANIQTGGNMTVHWGKMTSQGSMEIKRDIVTLPHFNAWHRVTFENGYDSASKWTKTTAYVAGDIVYPATLPSANFDDLYHYVASAGGTSGLIEPAVWPTAVGGTVPDGTIIWTRRAGPASYKVDASLVEPNNRFQWLNRLVGTSVNDPWGEARARGALITQGALPAIPAGVNQAFKYQVATVLPNPGIASPTYETATPYAGLSSWFQLQDATVEPEKKEVVFPRIDYQFWKEIALAGKGQDGVYYLRWVDTDRFTDGSATRTFKQWTNIFTGARPGFYFFDTRNGQNPQVAGGSAFLTPAIDISSAGGNTWTMSGFIYLNSAEFGTQGVSGMPGDFAFPGEPYRDIGYRELDMTGAGFASWKVMRNVAAPFAPAPPIKAGNRRWDYQEIPGSPTPDFDVVVQLRPAVRKPTGTAAGSVTSTPLAGVYLPVPYFDGCNPGVTCSEPHEPYLNLIYPLNACGANCATPNPMVVGWQNPATPVGNMNFPTTKKDDGTLPNCNTPSEVRLCTGNWRNKDGRIDDWSGGDGPVLNGVFYNEGRMNSSGNARYFGSVLINGNVVGTGTPDVFFDERLVKDEWPPKEWPFPRVYISAIQTDNQD